MRAAAANSRFWSVMLGELTPLRLEGNALALGVGGDLAGAVGARRGELSQLASEATGRAFEVVLETRQGPPPASRAGEGKITPPESGELDALVRKAEALFGGRVVGGGRG